MGSFSYSCQLSGLPITCGDDVILIPLIRANKWMDKYKSDKQPSLEIGTTHKISNDSTFADFRPAAFPIRGQYDDYGGIENIIEDDNTRILEEYFDLSIQTICNIITSNRKDDGFDGDLKVIKKPKSDNYNPDDDYDNPQYQERYEELVGWYGTWIRGDLYEELTNEKPSSYYSSMINLGTPKFLNVLGFKEVIEEPEEKPITKKKTETGEKDLKKLLKAVSEKYSQKERYNRVFEKDGFVVKSDGNWIDGSIYDVEKLQKLAKKSGVTLDNYEEFKNKTPDERLFDYIIHGSEWYEDIINKLDEDSIMRTSSFFHNRFLTKSYGVNSPEHTILYRFFIGQYEDDEDKKFSLKLLEHATKYGQLRDNFIRFWVLDKYMYSVGRVYEPVRTSPQFGEHRDVQKVLTLAAKINQEQVDEILDEEKI